MRDFCLMTDSCCDLDDSLARELNLNVVPLSVHFGTETYKNWLDGREISFKDFYKRVKNGEMPTTSAVSVGDFETAMRKELQAGRDILYIGFSSGLSTTVQSAAIAAQHLKKDFPDQKIAIVDSLCASGGQGLIAQLCALEKQAGKSLEEIQTFAEKNKKYICHWFTVDDLNHLKRGGRVNAATALFGSMLAIKPVLHVDDEGHLISMEKARGRRASILSLVEHIKKTAVNPEKYDVFITHGDCLDDAQFLADEVRKAVPVHDIHISYVGPVIGSHTGQGVVTLFFFGTPR